MVISATCVRSDGTVEGHEVPRESGPNGRWAQAIGSEGRFGVITTVTLRTHRLPRSRFYASRFFRSFEEGIGFLSSLDRFPTVARLSDTVETGISLAVAGDGALTSLARRYLRFRGGLGDPSMLVVVNNEMPAKLPDGGVSLGALPARSGRRGGSRGRGLQTGSGCPVWCRIPWRPLQTGTAFLASTTGSGKHSGMPALLRGSGA